jgi:hypothetical protein
MTKISTQLFAALGAILLVGNLVSCGDDNNEPASYKVTGPLTISAPLGYTRNLSEVADITFIYVDENGTLHQDPVTSAQNIASYEYYPSGYDLYYTATKTISSVSPSKVTTVGMMYKFTPKSGVELPSAISTASICSFIISDKNATYLSEGGSHKVSVTANSLASELATLSGSYNYTFSIDANGDTAIADKYQWSLIAQLSDYGDLDETARNDVQTILDNISSDFGNLRTSVLIAQALYNYQKETLTTAIKSYLAKTEAKLPITITYKAVSTAAYQGDFSQNIVIGK